MKLYVGKENDYKVFAVKHAKNLFGMYRDENRLIKTNIDNDG